MGWCNWLLNYKKTGLSAYQIWSKRWKNSLYLFLPYEKLLYLNTLPKRWVIISYRLQISSLTYWSQISAHETQWYTMPLIWHLDPASGHINIIYSWILCTELFYLYFYYRLITLCRFFWVFLQNTSQCYTANFVGKGGKNLHGKQIFCSYEPSFVTFLSPFQYTVYSICRNI